MAAPIVTAQAATKVVQYGATLNGLVNPNSFATTYQFEYGTTTGYGTVAPASPVSAGSGGTNVAAATVLTGLSNQTLYHFRLNATNSSGTTHGADGVFTTIKINNNKKPVWVSEESLEVRENAADIVATLTLGAPTAPLQDGTILLDPTTNLLWVRVNGLWKSTLLS